MIHTGVLNMSPNIIQSFVRKSKLTTKIIEKYIRDAEQVIQLEQPDIIRESDEFHSTVVKYLTIMTGVEIDERPIREVISNTDTMKLYEAVQQVTSNPFKLKSTVIFINDLVFTAQIQQITGIPVELVKRTSKASFNITMSEHKKDLSSLIDSIQRLYGGIPSNDSIYEVTRPKKYTYELTFRNNVVMK